MGQEVFCQAGLTREGQRSLKKEKKLLDIESWTVIIDIVNILILIRNNQMYTTVEVANKAGICKSTLLRWIHEGLMPDVGRDWRGWRVWHNRDVERVKAFQKAYHSEPIKRIRRRPINRVDYAKAAAQSMGSFSKGYFLRPGVGM